MARIRETLTADCPFSGAIEFAEKFFARNDKLPLAGAVILKTEVATTFDVVLDATDPARLHDALKLEWLPEEHLPLPAFTGLLTVRPHSGKSDLTLEGTYEPPFGAAGQFFDSILGEKIAHGTVRALLREIASFIETEWQRARAD